MTRLMTINALIRSIHQGSGFMRVPRQTGAERAEPSRAVFEDVGTAEPIRAPRRLPPGGARLRRRLPPLTARCSPAPYYSYCALRPRTASGPRGTRGCSEHFSVDRGRPAGGLRPAEGPGPLDPRGGEALALVDRLPDGVREQGGIGVERGVAPDLLQRGLACRDDRCS